MQQKRTRLPQHDVMRSGPAVEGKPAVTGRSRQLGDGVGHSLALLQVGGDQCSLKRFARDSLLDGSGFKPLVPLQNQHNRGTGPMSPTPASELHY
jgi:hypothetical protein